MKLVNPDAVKRAPFRQTHTLMVTVVMDGVHGPFNQVEDHMNWLLQNSYFVSAECLDYGYTVSEWAEGEIPAGEFADNVEVQVETQSVKRGYALWVQPVDLELNHPLRDKGGKAEILAWRTRTRVSSVDKLAREVRDIAMHLYGEGWDAAASGAEYDRHGAESWRQGYQCWKAHYEANGTAQDAEESHRLECHGVSPATPIDPPRRAL